MEFSFRRHDPYVEQLVASASAAVDKVVQMGLAERGRIAIGGHSYGAFMTVNLLAHSHPGRDGRLARLPGEDGSVHKGRAVRRSR
jgi:dipeptidyl aminopeptidase/acylaminoacyl peptidase